MTVKDLNRFQKTYPLLRIKPLFDGIDENTQENNQVKDSIFKLDTLTDDVYMPLSFDLQNDPSPFGVQITLSNDNLQNDIASIDIVMLQNGTVGKSRDKYFEVDNVLGDAILQ